MNPVMEQTILPHRRLAVVPHHIKIVLWQLFLPAVCSSASSTAYFLCLWGPNYRASMVSLSHPPAVLEAVQGEMSGRRRQDGSHSAHCLQTRRIPCESKLCHWNPCSRSTCSVQKCCVSGCIILHINHICYNRFPLLSSGPGVIRRHRDTPGFIPSAYL